MKIVKTLAVMVKHIRWGWGVFEIGVMHENHFQKTYSTNKTLELFQ